MHKMRFNYYWCKNSLGGEKVHCYKRLLVWPIFYIGESAAEWMNVDWLASAWSQFIEVLLYPVTFVVSLADITDTGTELISDCAVLVIS